MKISTISAAIEQHINAALVVTETDTRDVRYFEAFRNRVKTGIESALNLYYPNFNVISLTFAGNVGWFPSSKSKTYWVMSLGKGDVTLGSKADPHLSQNFKLGRIEIYFSEGKRGYICEGFNLVDLKEKKIKAPINGDDLASSMGALFCKAHSMRLRELTAQDNAVTSIYSLTSGKFPVVYGGIDASVDELSRALPQVKAPMTWLPAQVVILTAPRLYDIDPNDPPTVKPMRSKYPADKQYGFFVVTNVPLESKTDLEHYASNACKRVDQYMHSSAGVAYYDAATKTVRSLSNNSVLAKLG